MNQANAYPTMALVRYGQECSASIATPATSYRYGYRPKKKSSKSQRPGPRLARRMHPSETTLTLKYHEALPCQQQWHRLTKNVMTIHALPWQQTESCNHKL